MNKSILIVYSSRETQNSKKIAEALLKAFGDKAVIAPAGDAPDPNKFEYVIMGFGIYHGWPDGDMRSFMQRCKSQKVGIFLTLGAYPDSDHAKSCMGRAEGLMQSCKVYGRFICHGRLDSALVERSKNRVSGPHSWNDERAERIAKAENHPDADDLKNAVEIFSKAWSKISQKQVFNRTQETKNAILLVAFGTSYANAKLAYDNIEKQVATANPGVELRWAYTSRMVRNKLKRQGVINFSVAEILNKLLIENYTDVEIISTHVVPGAEYHKMAAEVNAFRNGALKFNSLIMSSPLLNNAVKLQIVCESLIKEIPPERSESDAVVLMGHGNHSGCGDMHYLAASAEFQRLDKNVFMATVEGVPDFAKIHKELLKRNIKKVWLMPFMIVAGDHACNDLAGEDKDSWKSLLEADNIECCAILKGLGEYNSIAKLFINP